MVRMLLECRKNIQNTVRVSLEYTWNPVRYFFTFSISGYGDEER